ncbi:unnamed protein product, partial [Brassica oleracea var. botrytis]
GGGGERGFPKLCRCGEEVVIKTSGTVKNPGRLFHCCPHGSETDKFHLFKWTDESAVEEIEDLKVLVNDLKGEIADLRADRVGFEKELGGMMKGILELERDRNIGCCAVM